MSKGNITIIIIIVIFNTMIKQKLVAENAICQIQKHNKIP